MVSYKGLRVLVTGGAGFIGSNLVDALLKNKAQFVRVLDNLSTGSLDNLKKAMKRKNFEFVEGDFRSYDTCRKCVEGIDVVFHEGALVSVPKSMEDPVLNNDINITGTLNMMKAASDAGVKRFVYASSAAVYGADPKVPKLESMDRDYQSPYALSKGVDEDYAIVFQKKDELGKGMTFVGLRYFNVYGPRQNPKSPYSGVISIFADKISKGETITLFGDGKQTRDFVYVMDVVKATMLSGKYRYPKTKVHDSQVFNVGTGKAVTLNQLIATIEKITKKKTTIDYKPPRSGDIKDSLASIAKIKRTLKYKPDYSLEKGLRLTLESLK